MWEVLVKDDQKIGGKFRKKYSVQVENNHGWFYRRVAFGFWAIHRILTNGGDKRATFQSLLRSVSLHCFASLGWWKNWHRFWKSAKFSVNWRVPFLPWMDGRKQCSEILPKGLFSLIILDLRTSTILKVRKFWMVLEIKKKQKVS